MADYRILWTQTARFDFEEIARFIANDSIDKALRVLERIEGRCAKLESHPERGRIVPELKAIDVFIYRELIEQPWRIVYRFDDKYVYVMAVLDSIRSLTGMLLERFSR